MSPTNAVAPFVDVMKKVRNIHAAKRICESSQARRRVSQGICKAERRRARREWVAESVTGKKDVIEADIVAGVPGVDGRGRCMPEDWKLSSDDVGGA